MAEKWGQIMHILARGDRELKQAMKGQVGTTFSSTNSSNMMGSFKHVYWNLYYCPVYNKKEVKIKTMPASKWH